MREYRVSVYHDGELDMVFYVKAATEEEARIIASELGIDERNPDYYWYVEEL